MTRLTKTTGLALALVLATPAVAQMAEIDVNADGMLSFPELQAAMPDMTDEDFTTLDANGDGLLDADEVAAAVEAGLLPAMEG